MATFDQMATIAGHETFKRRVRYCANKAAVAVMAEAVETAGHADRVVYAKKILDGSANLDIYAHAVVTNSTLTANGDISQVPNMGITDGDLEFTVNSIFNAMAGISL